ncbi:MAG: cysteine--tRNA ligase [Erysipelotrichaceae bacterium]|jgi:cysteinyl-tRNA synthetase|nr:cysteine--tRNA ligase [Erysipelotrichaceae bacterium]
MKAVKLYNALSDKTEVLKPLVKKQVSLYVCGPTVYDYPHIGNVRPPIVFGTLRNLLLHLGYEVIYVSNYTDIDDKIIKKAASENKTEKAVADFYINVYKDILKALNVLPPTHAPRVTEYIPAIIDFIRMLIDFGFAYEKAGNIYFSVNKIPSYGQLSKIKLDALKPGARVKTSTNKQSEYDFVLWKNTTEGIQWEAPFGTGRPGWHTECVVMIDKIFKGKMIDIHAGGIDLKFPHHENEMAQSEALYHHHLANFWIYNGILNIENQKMSKSVGNVVMANDFINQHGAVFTRFFMLKTHYRSPMNLTEQSLTSSKGELEKIIATFTLLGVYLQMIKLPKKKSPVNIDVFLDHLLNDLNAPNAISELLTMIKDANVLLRAKQKDVMQLRSYYESLKSMFVILGLEINHPILSNQDKLDIQKFLSYKEAKDFASSDQIRTKLLEKGININALNL